MGVLSGWFCAFLFTASSSKSPAPIRGSHVESDVQTRLKLTRSAFLTDTDGLLDALAKAAPADRDACIRKLLNDADLLFAETLLDSPLIDLLPSDLINAVAANVSQLNQGYYTEWLENTLVNNGPAAVAMLKTPLIMGIADPRYASRLITAYAEAATKSSEINLDQLTTGIVWGLSRLPGDILNATVAKFRFLPDGPFAGALAHAIGKASPEAAAALLARPLKEPLRSLLIEGATAAGTPVHGLTSAADLKAQARGLYQAALNAGAIDSVNLDSLITSATREDLSSLARMSLSSESDPSNFLTALLEKSEPRCDAFVTEIVTQYARMDPVPVSEFLSTRAKVPDGAIQGLIKEIKNDPEACLLWSLQLKDGAERNRLSQSFIGELMETDAARAEVLRKELKLEPTP